MTLQQIEYMLAVYRYKHFAKAAEFCHVTQPTLSAMIQKLEEELGIRIFDRKQQPVGPTPIGKQILAQGREVLLSVRKLKEIVEEAKHSLLGTFRIGILPTIAPYLIPRFFPQLMKKYPDMDVRITEMQTEDIKKALRHGDIDVGILALLDDMDEFDDTHLFYEQFFAYVSREDALYRHQVIRTADLKGEYLWLLDEGHCFSDQLVKFCQLKGASQSKKAYSLGSIETFMRMVESGKGVTFIPELSILQLNENQKEMVRPFAIPIPTRDIVMLTAKDFIRKTLREMLVKEIQKAVPKDMLDLKQTQQRI
ncbi:hydrogen peroxide-inducible genes activator [Phocaeicola abscessus]|uniref:hydrogen peroxide-inducible genes activator n=1 Tax=Phocaeicola abscessus TaxID=555313 RepID=UPI000385E234|nr:hydrogen peroxide-inducible genes activator [Phocaeicola abscessus]EPT34763.1 putative oxidative stress regulatory protein OxyR [Bacteroidetes bacterium oral taxon 272 str. F0290]